MQEEILKAIEQADSAQIDEILQAIVYRNDRLFPENEMIWMTLPKKDRNERRRILEWVTKKLLEEKF